MLIFRATVAAGQLDINGLFRLLLLIGLMSRQRSAGPEGMRR